MNINLHIYSHYRYFIDNDVELTLSFEPIALVPTMTSNTTPSGEVSANSEGHPAWNAFDNSTAYWQTDGSSSRIGDWLQYKFDSAHIVTKLGLTLLTVFPANVRSCSWTLKASNTNDDWNNADTLATITHSTAANEQMFNVDNKKRYLYYRLICDGSGNYYDSTQVKYFNMFVKVQLYGK